jgi:hypothetical protein
MNLISTKKSRKKWAKNKLEKLGKGYNKIHFGQTHASFIKEKKMEVFLQYKRNIQTQF